MTLVASKIEVGGVGSVMAICTAVSINQSRQRHPPTTRSTFLTEEMPAPISFGRRHRIACSTQKVSSAVLDVWNREIFSAPERRFRALQEAPREALLGMPMTLFWSTPSDVVRSRVAGMS